MSIAVHENDGSSMTEYALRDLVGKVKARLCGRIEDFRVDSGHGGLVLAGRSRTYYAKQLAQEFVRELIDQRIVANEIEVVKTESSGRASDL